MRGPDCHYMEEALRLAGRALGRTAPNPAVGAVVVQHGGIVGRGWTQPPGQAHAEVMALAEAGPAAISATLYITLEPCAHHGRTGPCADAIIAAGIARCVIAMQDPFPLVNGAGINRLRTAGVGVTIGPGGAVARRLNAGFFQRVRRGRPLVIAKYAMTLDGRIATRTGHSRWVSGAPARQDVHLLRDRTDAIMVGAGTVRADDPALTTRLPNELAGAGGPHHPLRVIVDGRGSSSLQARVFDPHQPGRSLVVTSAAAPPSWCSSLAARDVEVALIGKGPSIDLDALLDLLGRRGVNTLLVEGGARLHGALFDRGAVDRVVAFVAPKLVGGAGAPGPVAGHGVATMEEAWSLTEVTMHQLGADWRIEGDVIRDWPAVPPEEG